MCAKTNFSVCLMILKTMLQAYAETQIIVYFYCNNSSFTFVLQLKEHQLHCHCAWSKLGNETVICNEDNLDENEKRS